MISIILFTYFFTFLTLCQAAGTTPNGKRGVARIMDFGDNQSPFDKRDRVTW